MVWCVCASQPRVDGDDAPAKEAAPVERKLTPSDSADSLPRPDGPTRGESFYHPAKNAGAAPGPKPLPNHEGVLDDYTLRRGIVPRHMYTSEDINNPAIPPVHPDSRLSREEARNHPMYKLLTAEHLPKNPPNRWGPWENNEMVKEINKQIAELEANDPRQRTTRSS